MLSFSMCNFCENFNKFEEYFGWPIPEPTVLEFWNLKFDNPKIKKSSISMKFSEKLRLGTLIIKPFYHKWLTSTVFEIQPIYGGGSLVVLGLFHPRGPKIPIFLKNGYSAPKCLNVTLLYGTLGHFLTVRRCRRSLRLIKLWVPTVCPPKKTW